MGERHGVTGSAHVHRAATQAPTRALRGTTVTSNPGACRA